MQKQIDPRAAELLQQLNEKSPEQRATENARFAKFQKNLAAQRESEKAQRIENVPKPLSNAARALLELGDHQHTDWVTDFNQGRIADAMAKIKQEGEPECVAKVVLAYHQKEAYLCKKVDARVEKCPILYQGSHGICIEESDGGTKLLKPTELDAPYIITTFADRNWGDYALYFLYTRNQNLQIECLHADFRQMLKNRFGVFVKMMNNEPW